MLDFREERGRLVAAKIASQDPVDIVYGIWKLAGSTDDSLETLLGKVDAV